MSEENFDRIANEYDEAFPPHIVEHYLAKRVRYIAQIFSGLASSLA